MTNCVRKTAECIAEATRRPLLSLTCGDVGTNEVIAEQKLSKWFRLAESWGAVMLDEADVFLEKRSMADLQRNSLVSGQSPPTPPRATVISCPDESLIAEGSGNEES